MRCRARQQSDERELERRAGFKESDAKSKESDAKSKESGAGRNGRARTCGEENTPPHLVGSDEKADSSQKATRAARYIKTIGVTDEKRKKHQTKNGKGTLLSARLPLPTEEGESADAPRVLRSTRYGRRP